MTKDELIQKLIPILQASLYPLADGNLIVTKIASEHTIGIEIGDDTFFLEVQEG